VIKVIWHWQKVRIAAAHRQFSGIRQAAPVWTPPNACLLWAHPSLQPKRQLDRFSRFCRAHYCDRQTDI